MENSKEKCPDCGKKYKFLKKHIKRSHSSVEKSGKSPGKVQEISREKNPSFLKEINLKGEFDKMADIINPKKDESKEQKYECGACHNKFNDKYKRCPHCGVEFE